jgi:hypothetical protein
MWYWGECKEGWSYSRLETVLWSLLCNWMYQASIRKQWGIAYLIFNWMVYCRVHNIPLVYRFLGASVHSLPLLFFKMYFNITPVYTWDFHVVYLLLGPFYSWIKCCLFWREKCFRKIILKFSSEVWYGFFSLAFYISSELIYKVHFLQCYHYAVFTSPLLCPFWV